MYDYGFGISNVDSLDYATPQLNVYLNLSKSRIDMLEEVSMIISVNKGFGKTSVILHWDDSVNVGMISVNNEFGRTFPILNCDDSVMIQEASLELTDC